MKVLDKGEAKLLNFMGGDLAVVASARVSNGISYEESSKGAEKDAKLINYLVKHRHGTPFEHSVFQFYIKAPIFVIREWQRHRIASYNEISGRYVEFNPEFYFPDRIRVSAEINKQGSVFPKIQTAKHDMALKTIEDASNFSYRTYLDLLHNGIAKEMARMVLPLNLYSEFYFTVNARSLMNFLSLRTAQDAQYEIREYAYVLEDIFKEKMLLTWNAWNSNERIAP